MQLSGLPRRIHLDGASCMWHSKTGDVKEAEAMTAAVTASWIPGISLKMVYVGGPCVSVFVGSEKPPR